MAAVALAACPAVAADARHESLTAAQFATCKAAADQPTCLLKLSAHSRFHTSFRENIAIGYSPDVLASVGPDPADDLNDRVNRVLHHAYKVASLQVLIADHDGVPPRQALEPIRAMPVRKAPDPADQPQMERSAAVDRTMAYRVLWKAGHGDKALPPAHRPSEALLREVLRAWRADLSKAGDGGGAEELAEAYREFGDTVSAGAVAPQTPADQVKRLIDAGRYAEAAGMLDRADTAPSTGSPAEAEATAAMNRFFQAMMEGQIIRAAVDGGRTEVAVALAEKAVDRWLKAPIQASSPMTGAPLGDAMQVAPDLLLIVEKAPRPQALKWTERMDAAARNKTVPPAPVSAVAAMRAWTKLGDPARAQALATVWKPDVAAATAACRTLKTCASQPALIIAISLKGQPLNTPWDELAPVSEHRAGTSVLVAAGRAGIDARLAATQDPWGRMTPLFQCASDATEAKELPLATYCAHRLAAEPSAPPKAILPGLPPLRPERVNSILRVARGAQQQNDPKAFADMLALAFDLAAKEPEEDVGPAPLLEDIAIAELRQQGRL